MGKLFVYEMYKLFHQRTVIAVCVCAVIANLFTFWVVEHNYGRFYSRGEIYESFQKKYDKPEEPDERIESMERVRALTSQYEDYFSMMRKTMSAEEYEKTEKKFLDTYGKESLAELEEMKQNMNLSTVRCIAYYSVTWKMQAEYAKEYADFRNEMEERQNELEKFSIFSEKGSYSGENLKKTAAAFHKLGPVEISLGNQTGIKAFLAYDFSGVFLVSIAFILAAGLWQKERGMITLLKSKRKGKSSLFLAKIAALVVGIFFMTILCRGMELCMSDYLYGLGDLSMSVQSVNAYRNCCLPLSAGQFMVLCVLTQALVTSVIGILLFLLFAAFKNNGYVYLVGGGILLLSLVCYGVILPTGTLSFFKYVNLAFGMQPAKLFGTYRNINVFGKAVSLLQLFVLFILVLLVAGLCFGLFFWNTGRNIGKRSFLHISFSKKIRGGIGILRVQMKEYFLREKKALLWLLLAMYGIYTAFYSPLYHYTGSSPDEYFTETYYKEEIKEIEGTLNADTDKKIRERQQYFDDVWEQIEILSKKKTKSANDNAKLMALDSQTGYPIQAFELLKEQYDLVKGRQQAGKNAVLLDKYSWNRLFENTGTEVRNLMLAGISTVMLCGTVFSDRKKMKHLTASMKKGRRSLWRRQYLLGIGGAICSWLCLVVPELVLFLREKPVGLMGAALGNLPLFEHVKEEYSIGLAVIMMYAASLLLCTALSCLTMILVDITNDSFIIMVSMAAGWLLAGAVLMGKNKGVFGEIVLHSSYPVRNLILVVLLLLLLTLIPVVMWECEVLYPKRKVGMKRGRKK